MDARSELISYRLQKARNTLEDANVLAASDRWSACVNRLYYACFYAVTALLLHDNLSSTKHTGIRSLFNQHYIKTSKISREWAEFYNDLFEKRQESDYVDFVQFEEDQVKPLLLKAKTFIQQIEDLLHNLQ